MASVSRFEIELLPSAARQLSKLPADIQIQLAETIEKLGSNPLHSGVQKLKGKKKGDPDTFRVRSGDYRILFRIINDELTILIIRLGHRREIYK